MGVTYSESGSALVKVSEHGIWKAGNRCPDMILKKTNGNETRLYTETTYGKYLLLHVGGTPSSNFGFNDVVTPYTIRASTDVGTVETSQLTQNGGLDNGETDANKTYTADWASKDDDPFVVIVRPDMHIGFVGQSTEEAKQYLSDLYIS